MKKVNTLFIIGTIFTAVTLFFGIWADAWMIKAITNTDAEGFENLGYLLVSIYWVIIAGAATVIATPLLAIANRTLTPGTKRLSTIFIILDWLIPLVWVVILVVQNLAQ